MILKNHENQLKFCFATIIYHRDVFLSLCCWFSLTLYFIFFQGSFDHHLVIFTFLYLKIVNIDLLNFT